MRILINAVSARAGGGVAYLINLLQTLPAMCPSIKFLAAVPEFEVCTGCGACVPKCPGLAIFIVNMKHTPGMATLTMSYELLPLPVKGQEITATDRSGKAVCKAKVIRVINPPAYDRTAAVTIEIPADRINEIRSIRV